MTLYIRVPSHNIVYSTYLRGNERVHTRNILVPEVYHMRNHVVGTFIHILYTKAVPIQYIIKYMYIVL